VGLERGPLSLVNTIEELLGRKISGCGLEHRPQGIYRTDYLTPLYSQKWALISPTCGGGLVGIVHSQTKVTELFHLRMRNSF
jgi:hypothetical protein